MNQFWRFLIAQCLVVSVVLANFEVTVEEQVVDEEPKEKHFDESFFEDAPEKLVVDCESDDYTCVTREKLQEFCTSVAGAVEGGRCFFSGTARNNNWSQGWATCAAKGGIMAQMHSTADRNAVRNVLIAGNADQSGYYGQWYALRRDSSVNSGPFSLDPETTFWYHSETEYDKKLTVANTYIRKFKTDYVAVQGQYCMVMWHNLLSYVGGNNDCARPDNGVACMKTSTNQRFKLEKDKCINAPVIRQYPNQSPKECAKKCAKNPNWCRSFNVHTDNTCDLLSWVWQDRDEEKSCRAKRRCLHYTYDN